MEVLKRLKSLNLGFLLSKQVSAELKMYLCIYLSMWHTLRTISCETKMNADGFSKFILEQNKDL